MRDVFTEECLAIDIGRCLIGEQVVAVLKRIAVEPGAPEVIFCDIGSKLVGCATELRAYVNRVRIEFSTAGKPIDHVDVESFNGRLRDESLNSHWFVLDAGRRARNRSLARRLEYFHKASSGA